MDFEKYDKKRVMIAVGMLAAILIILVVIMGGKGVFWFFGGIAFLSACLATSKGDAGLKSRLVAVVVAVVAGLIAYGIGQIVFS